LQVAGPKPLTPFEKQEATTEQLARSYWAEKIPKKGKVPAYLWKPAEDNSADNESEEDVPAYSRKLPSAKLGLEVLAPTHRVGH
jgi:hypothetical protein